MVDFSVVVSFDSLHNILCGKTFDKSLNYIHICENLRYL